MEEKEVYVAPTVEVLEFSLEQGFAATQNTAESLEGETGTWDGKSGGSESLNSGMGDWSGKSGGPESVVYEFGNWL